MSKLEATLSVKKLCSLLVSQLNKFWPDGEIIDKDDLCSSANKALERLEYCFSRVNNRYFFDGKKVIFDHLHGDQYAMWLYIFSNQLFLDELPISWAKKVFLLNKALHGCDIFYEIQLPSIFLLVHPIGTVLGRGVYNDYFIAYQRCGIGSNHDQYPRLGRHVTLHPGSSILGNCSIGDNVAIASDSLVMDIDIESNQTYFGNPHDHWKRSRATTEKIWRK